MFAYLWFLTIWPIRMCTLVIDLVTCNHEKPLEDCVLSLVVKYGKIRGAFYLPVYLPNMIEKF